jgi:glycosyltransferase involved in cell wall biosynthesis
VVKVSIIIPVYNGAATVAGAVACALAQEFDGFEVIVIDDGSSDNTLSVLRQYSSCITVLSQPNRGAAAARNAGARAARGEFLAFLDADDRWLPGRVSATMSALEASPDAVLAFCDLIPLDPDGTEHPPTKIGRAPSLAEMLAGGWGPRTSAVTLRKSAFIDCGGFSERFKGCGFEDGYMWLLMRERGEFEYVAEPLVIYRNVDFPHLASKYSRNYKLYTKLLRKRYGKQADPLIVETRRVFASSLISRATVHADNGDLTGAFVSIVSALRYDPGCLIRGDIRRRVLRRLNLWRAARDG